MATCLFQMKKKTTSDTLLHVDCQIMNFDVENIRKMKLNKLLLCSMKDLPATTLCLDDEFGNYTEIHK